ncbi:TerB family tellurite resistance protein [Breoghania sp.]|uniref:tellurite resistance TerB family protein n=1 Tax=Breoghania sp. TaxID=2065378 RepID=UPI003204CD6D
MLKKIQKFLRDVTVGEDDKKESDTDDQRLCTAALMVHLISVDGVVDDSERSKLREILKTNYELDDKATSELIEETRKRNMEAVDLYGFTSVLKSRRSGRPPQGDGDDVGDGLRRRRNPRIRG